MDGFLGWLGGVMDGLLGNGFDSPSDPLAWMWDGSPAIWNGDGSSPVLTP